MSEDFLPQLEGLGLPPAEARVYLALVRHGPLPRRRIVELTGLPRSSVYATLDALADRGMVSSGAGYGATVQAASPEVALPVLVEEQRREVEAREERVKDLAERLAPFTMVTDDHGPIVEELRNPRMIQARYEELQREAVSEMAGLCKGPIISPSPTNPTEFEALRRGVRYRTIYQAEDLDNPVLAPCLKAWSDAGEEARIYRGVLPMKLIIADGRVALAPLETDRGVHPVTSLVIRHPSLVRSLMMLFDTLWERSTPWP